MKCKICKIETINVNGSAGVEAKITTKNDGLENKEYIVLYKEYDELSGSYEKKILLSEDSLGTLYTKQEELGCKLEGMERENQDYSEKYMEEKKQYEMLERVTFDYLIKNVVNENDLDFEKRSIIKILKLIMNYNEMYR